MLPNDFNDGLKGDFTIAEQPTQTYRLDFDGAPASGKIDGVEAMRQAILLALNTERFTYAIYSWNYGIELRSLFGQGITPYLQARLQHVVEEALLQDDRILQVTGFTCARAGRDGLRTSFIVHTTQGDVPSELNWGGKAA